MSKPNTELIQLAALEPPYLKNPERAAFVAPAEALRRVIARTRYLPPPLPREPERENEPGYWEWYQGGIERNRARSLAELGIRDPRPAHW